VKDGNWSDITIWQTASGRVGKFPSSIDDVYIRHNINSNINTIINGLYVSGIFTINAGIQLELNSKFIGAGNSQLINKGRLYFLSQIGAEQSYSNGIYDITTFANIIGFIGNYDATIPSYYKTFHNLTTYKGIKTISTNTIINGNLTIGQYGILELSWYNLIVNGTSAIGENPISGGYISKFGDGNLLFVGNMSTENAGVSNNISFTGNVLTEFRGGITGSNNFASNWGTGSVIFTTNNQTINPLSLVFNCPVNINSNIEITTNSTGGISFSSTINGLSSTSKLINRGIIKFINQLAAENSMSIGINDFTTFANTIHYEGNYTATIPSYFNTFHNLTISGTGTKSLGVNTTLNGNLVVNGGGTFELSTYNIVINGTTSLSPESTTIFPLQKSGSGSVTFVGLLSFSNGFGNRKALNFSGGNPSVELRGGISFLQQGDVFLTGTGTWTFSTNNQNITSTAGLSAPIFSCTILISGAITLSQVNNSASSFTATYINTINGNNANSKFLMGSVSTGANTLNYQSATQPMATGILDTSTNLNTWIYGLNNQDIKGSPTISPKQVYRNLTLNGTGVKTLQGYCSVLNTYTLTAPATLANNGFTLTNP
jgi:hypothetical protein